MRLRAFSLSALLFSLAVVGAASTVEAQGGMLDRMKRRAEEQIKRRVEDRAERAVDKTLDGAENSIKCVLGDSECVARAEKAGKKVVLTDADGEALPPGTQPTAKSAAATAAEADAKQRPGEGAWANYDFVPGERPLLVTDFAEDVVGDFPRRLEASEGNYEIVEWKGARWLRANGSPNRMYVPAGGTLPSRWTLEFEMLGEDGECWIYPDATKSNTYFIFNVRHSGGLNAAGRSIGARNAGGEETRGTPFTARIMVDGRYAKAYVNESRMVNVPNLDYAPDDKLLFYCDGNETSPIFLRNFRLAAGGRKLYDALTENGRVATQGIYFDTGSDQLRPESTPTLKEIGGMLTENPSLRIVIEGHTDNVGNAATNLTLSQKRAESVRQYLISAHGVAADRLTAQGMGQEKPVADNTAPEGRQQNRRVELVQVK